MRRGQGRVRRGVCQRGGVVITLRMRAVVGTTQHDDAIKIPAALLRAMVLPELPVRERIEAFAEYVDAYEAARHARVTCGSATIGVVAWTVEGPRGRETGRSLLTADGGPLREQISAGLAPALAPALRA